MCIRDRQGPDVSGVTWKGGKYDTKQLSNVYTVDHFMVKRVLQEVHHKVSDPMTMKALGFCVDIAHADFMAEHFNRAGLSAEAVSSNTNDKDRAAALARLRDGSLRVLFSVNLFNEGVDVPDVDTVLFLRPTESATLFLQQLGRGLRRSDDKECLTVLDFIGHANRRFRFDRRFRAIVGGTRRQIERHVKEGFPFLPSGCSIHLDRHAQEAVLENIRSTLGAGYKSLVEDVRALARQQGTATLRAFVEEAGVELEDIYAGGRCFTDLLRAAGLDPSRLPPRTLASAAPSAAASTSTTLTASTGSAPSSINPWPSTQAPTTSPSASSSSCSASCASPTTRCRWRGAPCGAAPSAKSSSPSSTCSTTATAA